jgi:hypothetical protein
MSQDFECPIQLFRVSDQLSVEGRLCSLNSQHLNEFGQIWKPILLSSSEADQYWDWEQKYRTYGTRLGAEKYAVECDGMTQGLMLMETLGHRSWFDANRRVVYIRSLATAPWNRRSLNPSPEYRLVGTVLLAFARYRSEELGYGGLVGLHALSGAEAFYRQSGMLDCGRDAAFDDLVYFEYYQPRSPDLEWEDSGVGEAFNASPGEDLEEGEADEF